MNKSKSKSKSYEFWSMFLLVIGMVIGAGIYLKNQELLSQTNNPIVATSLWAVVGLVLVLSVVIFIEISKSTMNHGNGTLGNWLKIWVGRRTASVFSVMYSYIFIPSVITGFMTPVITYFLITLDIYINPLSQLFIYLFVGIFILITIYASNVWIPKVCKGIQLFASVFKFIPLFVALIAGFVLWGDNSSFNDETYKQGATAITFLSGFGAILLSFDGYVYIANMQKGATHKEQVPKALIAGMIFVSVFYVIMAIALFGGGDGSIVGVLSKIFGNSASGHRAAVILANTVMMLVCFTSTNVFVSVGMTEMLSDYNAKVIYLPKEKANFKFVALLQFLSTTIFYIVLVLLGTFVPRGDWEGINSGYDLWENIETRSLFMNAIGDFIGQMASALTAYVFIAINTLIVAAMINRFTNKVKVEKLNSYVFWPAAIISSIMLAVINIMAVVIFIIPTNDAVPFVQTGQFIFLLFFILSIIASCVLWTIQEKVFKKHNETYSDFSENIDENMKLNNWD
ncbi:basic amino acid/polyamine antiporter, APA family [Spiroplasma sp. TIUS-1]|uniref:amino acid permease n=1 Tax=Spiroplasma sp. TIUS-1 TaxID=216963 RepID=UPI0013972C54|nr:amino acid permease [Spiroplasma sp. TIUS-1]QHX35678.1 basic amino acid/polyamine antiporter, APA family [Spiroplasma sp. TIUS-1]